MKNVRTLLAFSTIGLSLAASSAIASELEPIRVTVPFAFTAGKTNLPAGSYTVSENEAHVLMIRGTKGGIVLLATPGSDTDEEKSALSFQHTDKGYALKAIHASGRASIVPATAPVEK